VRKTIAASLVETAEADYVDLTQVAEDAEDYLPLAQIAPRIERLRKEMKAAAADLEFERAAELRDEIQRLQERELALRERRLDG
jgi:excinuclease ABC subunit B